MNPKNWSKFIQICAKERNEAHLDLVFQLLLTHEERESLETRLQIVQSLFEGKMTQREISEHFNVSIAKITRGSNELKRLNAKELEQLKKSLNAGEKS